MITYEAPPRQRMARYGLGICIDEGPDLWWLFDERRWSEDFAGKHAGTHAPCRTLKAFKRHLRRHAKELAGCKVRWVNRYMGCDVIADFMEVAK